MRGEIVKSNGWLVLQVIDGGGGQAARGVGQGLYLPAPRWFKLPS